MALRVVRPEPAPSVLPYGDALLLRLAREHRRLGHLQVATGLQIEKHEYLIAEALKARHLSRVEVDGFVLRLDQRGRLVIS
jgi:hypothetical protein